MTAEDVRDWRDDPAHNRIGSLALGKWADNTTSDTISISPSSATYYSASSVLNNG